MTPGGRSREVVSAQQGVHPRLERLLERRRRSRSRWSRPLHAPTVRAFGDLCSMLGGETGGLVLDSGCGTGESTRRLAEAMPGRIVVGVDKSAARLGRTGATAFPHRERNAVWLRADLASFWRLAADAGWRLHRHYLLFPNPWPKPKALSRRWHAHPVFPDLLRLGGRLEMRCNWAPYAEEFAFAANRLLGTGVAPADASGHPVLSPFELKYRRSGHQIYSIVVSCGSCGSSGV